MTNKTYWLKCVLLAMMFLACAAPDAQAQDSSLVFARGNDGALLYYEGGCWQSLGGEIVGAPDAASWGPDRVDVFVRGTDNQLWQIARVNGQWTQWFRLAAGIQITSSPSAVSWGPNRIDVFALGPNHMVWHREWDGERWRGWEPLPEQEFASGSAPDASSMRPNTFDVFARKPDGSLWWKVYNAELAPDQRWGPWLPIPMEGRRITSDPGAIAWGSDRTDVFARGEDSQIWQVAWTGDGRWYWHPQGGEFDSGSGPDAASAGANRLDIYAQGKDKALWRKRWDGSNWSRWDRLGGAIASDPGAVVARGARPQIARARFRVSITGFKVNHETADDLLSHDGRFDEVFIKAGVRVFDRNGTPVSNRFSIVGPTAVMGDTWGLETATHDIISENGRRIQAGNASDRGGLRGGNRFPTDTPWIRGEVAPFPLILWEGELICGENGVMVVPAIWEWDTLRGPLDTASEIAMHDADREIGPSFARWIAGDHAGETPLNIVRRAFGNRVSIPRSYSGPRHRPIGMKVRGDVFAFEPNVLVMTYETALLYITGAPGYRFAESDNSITYPVGVVPFYFRDDPGYDGDYTLYLQVERLP